ncbi:oligogalacturonate-specific porin KdgM family protein (plasmid) [Photobacterium sp. DA100]|uniref:oligogalacturonate-specific porin KdgM family protein n=1 Tax=Photobacterium sp. DA100 TaxID=3027472 RepID=UPI00247B0056|nr:oligogalacturonate-specific porin KdgM family protein [Photobacterium sp. DA100]WEM45536.1 oligogalacturonate-specific porin KdgM family protein [Photobacterium sp. DA100]
MKYKAVPFLLLACSSLPIYASESEPEYNESNPLWIEVYTRYEEDKDLGLQGIIGRIDFPEFWGTYFAAELNTDGYYEWAVGKGFGIGDNAYIDVYLGYTKWNYRLSLRTGYNFDNGLMLSARVRPEFGYDDWIGEDNEGNTINYGTNLGVRTDLFLGYNSTDYEFFYNRVDHFETDEEIADAFKHGKQHTTTDHEFRITYTKNKWRPYFQWVYMENGLYTPESYKDDIRWQLGFTLPM